MRRQETLEVAEGQYAPLPNTKDYVLVGPGELAVTRYADGKLSGEIVRGRSIPTQRAVKAQLKRVVWEI